MPLNPVERRVALLSGEWIEFSNDISRLFLIWQVPANAIRLVQAFFEAQKHDTIYSTRDVFVVFDVSFEHSIQYSKALKKSLRGQYSASCDDFELQSIRADWNLDLDSMPDSATGFVRSLMSLASTYQQHIGRLVAVLLPTSVKDNAAYVSWLSRCLTAGVSERVRFLTLDSLEAPRLELLTAAAHPMISVTRPNIDAFETAQETFAQEGAVGPAAVFRNYLIGLITLAEKGSAEQVRTKASDALAFVRRQEWVDQEIVVTMLLAGALLKEGRFDEAVTNYLGARRLASSTAAEGHPSRLQLVLQTWFGEAATHLAARAIPEASACYDQAITVARQIPDLILAIEAARMAMFCQIRMHQRDAAIERGMNTLADAAKLDAAVRATSTLPIAALDLLRIIDPQQMDLIERTKTRLSTRIATSRRVLEQRAGEIEHHGNQQDFARLDSSFESESAAANLVAINELEALAAGAKEDFVRVFSTVRDLLGSGWQQHLFDALPYESD